MPCAMLINMEELDSIKKELDALIDRVEKVGTVIYDSKDHRVYGDIASAVDSMLDALERLGAAHDKLKAKH